MSRIPGLSPAVRRGFRLSCFGVVWALGLRSPSSLGQRKRHVGVATLRPHFSSAARDYQVLPTSRHVGGGCCISAGGKFRLPQHFACLLIKRANHLVLRRCDENEPACRHYGTSVVLGAGGWKTAAAQFGKFSQRSSPGIFARVEVDGV